MKLFIDQLEKVSVNQLKRGGCAFFKALMVNCGRERIYGLTGHVNPENVSRLAG